MIQIMKKVSCIISLILIIFCLGCDGNDQSVHTESSIVYVPEDDSSFILSDYEDQLQAPSFQYDMELGPVLDEETAIVLAEEQWLKIYSEHVFDLKPYQVLYDAENEVWLVKGVLPKSQIGGVTYLLIQKEDGKVLAIWHDK